MTELVEILTAISLFCAPQMGDYPECKKWETPKGDVAKVARCHEYSMAAFISVRDGCRKKVWACIDKARKDYNEIPPKKECREGGYSGLIFTGTTAASTGGKITRTETCTTTEVEKWKPERFEECFR